MPKNNVDIHLTHVSKEFGNVSALRDVSADFVSGHLYGVIGPAGAGKTTLFRIMLHLMRAGGGDVSYKIDGRDISFADFRHHMAYMPQSQSLYADLSVDEHLDFFRKLYGIDAGAFARRRDELLHLTRLDKFTQLPAGKLSGGMYKKLGLMCALLRSPRVMLLDEPTNGVDPISRREFWTLLHESVARGILIILSTAYMDEAERCTHVTVMDRGCVLRAGEPTDLLRRARVQTFDEFFIRHGGGAA
ncbi:ABC transporter ATP-binding protein [bacterium]|nr:ABC transporter ATP-binding protein [bacterium]